MKLISLVMNNTVLNEGISNVTYHFCPIVSCMRMLSEGHIALTMSSNASDAKHGSQMFYLSTQRTKSLQQGYAYNSSHGGKVSIARLELNGDLLSRDGYAGGPTDYWYHPIIDMNDGSLPVKVDRYGNVQKVRTDWQGKQSDIGPDAYRVSMLGKGATGSDILKAQQHASNFEFEDRIFSDSPFLDLKYINRIDIYVLDLSVEAKLCIELGQGKVFVYNNQKDFLRQSDNTINDVLLEAQFDNEEELMGSLTQNSNNYGSAKLVIDLCALYLYADAMKVWDAYDTSVVDKLIVDTLSRFNLDRYSPYVKDIRDSITNYFLPETALHYGSVDDLRKMASSTKKPADYKEILLFAQAILKKYKVNNFTALAYVLKNPKKETPKTVESVPCVKRYWGAGSYSIYKADDKLFWDSYNKNDLYSWVVGALDEDDWNEEHGYTDRRVYHKSKNSESFKKYIQHLMHNDNLSLYDGVVLLCKIIPDNNQREMIVGMKDEPLLVNKDNFNELQNKLGYDDATNIVNALFGNWDGFYDWMRDNNKW